MQARESGQAVSLRTSSRLLKKAVKDMGRKLLQAKDL